MRTWGRTFALNPDGTKVEPQPAGYPRWVKVESDPMTGDDSWVFVTALCQVLLLNLNESPFYVNWGIPAKPTVVQQVQPDYYVSRVQAQFAPQFANLVVAKTGSNPPSYRINVTTRQGAKASVTVQIPQ